MRWYMMEGLDGETACRCAWGVQRYTHSCCERLEDWRELHCCGDDLIVAFSSCRKVEVDVSLHISVQELCALVRYILNFRAVFFLLTYILCVNDARCLIFHIYFHVDNER